MPALSFLGAIALLGSLASAQPAARPFRLLTAVPSTADGSTQDLAGLWVTTYHSGAGQEVWTTTSNSTMSPTWFIEDTQIKRVAYGDTKFSLTLGGPPYLSDAPSGLDVISSGVSGQTLSGWSPLVQSDVLVNPAHPEFQWAACKVNTTVPFYGQPTPGIQVFWFNSTVGHAPYPAGKCATIQMHGVIDS